MFNRLLIVFSVFVVSACGQDSPLPTTDVNCRVDGVEYSEACLGPKPETLYCGPIASRSALQPHTVGSVLPGWRLQDQQPQSCGYEQFYGLDEFRGTPTVVVLLWAGCSFCQRQAEKLQELQFELSEQGAEVDFVIINRDLPNPPIEELTTRCFFPVFQDVEPVNAWGSMKGNKDDFYFYTADGLLDRYIPATSTIDLSTEEGYALIFQAALSISETTD